MRKMNKRFRVVLGSVLTVIAAGLVFSGSGQLNASGIVDTDFNIAKILTWVGVSILIVGALLFISASAAE
ncbi:hypothetical protein A3A71_01635 [Candidatus Berkelbacteria bacterium RIFCSPLOWO2_01_FULL_50_28]|uniref:DUF3185 domain-containing protein n=1 Tax=Candidatus Berkelbacteria bacterium RIFCSPLOWO2_01_FULL_50_28 TaxID=1797471 RepID=A0A1F5EBY5_9BACT|nr:MAG: hypothetical protein A3F39_01475 [Candidatus Berkelbacteria bacterium RIFCSPHIGHO2_12_FULL_50_11]OGD64734.1 MAG: hypothetical protein A3A71_01635 [Candidatus Berkelbacteria bacterium RIFCSPLOWO2_01_FULL_50_28]